jgi:hypothetical protein
MPPDRQCIVAKVALTAAQNNAINAQAAANNACPDDVLSKNLADAQNTNNAFVNEKRKELQRLDGLFDKSVITAQRFADLAGSTNEYLKKLENENKHFKKDSLHYEQAERTKRRQFLDGEPQSGVLGIPGLRTYDDKVLFSFIITYGVSIVALTLIGLNIGGGEVSFSKKISSCAGSLAVAYGIAYYAIYTYA